MTTNHTHNIQNFWVAGINYKKTDTAVRGAYAISPEQYDRMLATAPEFGISEFFVLSTCNRTEIYGCATESAQLTEFLCSVSRGNAETFTKMAYLHNGYEAIQHLFHVAAGLDSQILGDFEILGQIKKAAKHAKSHGFIGAFMERLMNSVLQSSKAIKTNTALSSGTVSVSFAAVQYIRERMPELMKEKIVLVGAGKIGGNTCRNLKDYLGTKNIILINRTAETARSLAEELGINWAPMEQLQQELDSARIVLVSTNADKAVITPEHITGTDKKLIIDLSVPCNVAAEVGQINGITLVNVDELSRIKDETLQMRENEVPKAKEIISEHIAEFKAWYDMRKHVPMLKEVKNKLREMVIDSQLVKCQQHAVQDETIQSVINVMATKMRRNNAPGCHYIEAINDFIAYHE